MKSVTESRLSWRMPAPFLRGGHASCRACLAINSVAPAIGPRAVGANTADQLFQIWQDIKQNNQEEDDAYIHPWQRWLSKPQRNFRSLLPYAEQGKKLLPMNSYDNE